MKENRGQGDYSMSKNTPTMELRGLYEEVMSMLGLTINLLDRYVNEKVRCNEILKDLRNQYYDLLDNQNRFDYRRVKLIETWCDAFNVPTLSKPYFPIGNKTSCQTSVLLSKVRQLEIHLIKNEKEDFSIYMNRLGDYFYLLTRYINYEVGIEDYL